MIKYLAFSSLSLLLAFHLHASDAFDEAQKVFSQKDYPKALELFTQACNEKDGAACRELGYMYDHAWGTPKDSVKAVGFYEKACRAKDGKGCMYLGYMYENGRGVKKDIKKSKEFYSDACRFGNMAGCSKQ